MYNSLNDLILFGGNSCNNAHSLTVKIINDLDIPTLKLAYPNNQEQLIDLIDNTNYFLKNLDNDYDPDNLSVDLKPKSDKLPISDVKELLDKFI